MGEPTTLTITLDLDRHLAQHIGYDADGEPVQQHTTVEDLVLDLVAHRLVDRIVHMRGGWDEDVRKRVKQLRDDVIVERVTPLVDEALATAVQKTNAYGEPVGEPTTMRAVIVEEATAWLTKPVGDSYTRERKTNIATIIAKEVDTALRQELKTALDQAKTEVIEAVQAKGAEVLAKTIAQMAGAK